MTPTKKVIFSTRISAYLVLCTSMNDLCVNELSWTESSSFLEVSLFTKLKLFYLLM